MATGRDEMLKKNQQKSKRKGLMEVLADYRREEAQKREYKPKNTPSMGKKAAKAKSNTKTAYSGKSLIPSGKKKTATQVAFSGASLMKTKPSNPKPSAKPQASNPKPSAKPQASNAKPSAKPMPSNPQYKNITMKPRKKRPGTGRTGEAAAKAANRTGPKPKNVHKATMTAAERRAMRRRARRGR